MGGAGIVGSGGAGVGGWQLYEGVINPTLDRQISRDNYSYKPAQVPLDESVSTSTNNKYDWKSWDCVSKLFPTLASQIKHTDASGTASTPTVVKEWKDIQSPPNQYFPIGYAATSGIPLYLEIPTTTQNLVSCALFDLRKGTDASKEKSYFKSEVVVKDENYGWVMWNGLSSNPSDGSKKVDFEYRLLTFKKENNGGWKIDKGFGWSTPSSSTNNGQDRLHVAIPDGHKWNTTKINVGDGYSSREIWSGIAKVETGSQKHMTSSLQIYMKSAGDGQNNTSGVNYNAEFFGMNGGKWTDVSGVKGYSKANKMYVDGQGWQSVSDTNLRNTLTAWYKPWQTRKIKWTTCDSWSRERKTWSSVSVVDQEIKNVCYSKTS